MTRSMDMQGGGRLMVSQDGPRVRLTAERPADQKGLYKVWLHGDNGKEFLLGTLLPEERVLRLSRTISIDELQRRGCWPEFWVEVKLAFPFGKPSGADWYCEQNPGRFLADEALKKGIQGAMLCRREKDGISLAAPFRTDRPVPLAGLFCLGRVEQWPKGCYIVWRFDNRGIPKIWYNRDKSGQTSD